MNIGMPVLIENASINENIELCKKLSLNFIELNMSFPQYQLSFLEGNDFNKLAKDNGICFTIHLDENFNVADFNPLTREAHIETIKRVIVFCKKNNIKTINMHMNHGIVVTLPNRKVYLYEIYFDNYLDNIIEFRDLCVNLIGDSDIKICIENTDGFRIFEKKAIDTLLESDVFALTWDIGHSATYQEIDQLFIMNHEERLHHFHIHDATVVPARNHLALGDGDAPIEDRLDLASKLGCSCVLETKTIKALEKSISWLKEHSYE